MYVSTDRFPLTQKTGKAFSMYFSNLRPVFLDIETTGLSPGSACVILIGVLRRQTDGSMLSTLYFAETPAEEPDVLRAFSETLRPDEYLITFNGRRFDVPFLLSRMKRCGINPGLLPRLYNLDLYPIVRSYSGFSEILPSLSQKSLEQMAGIEGLRRDRIDGGESVRLYERYVERPDEQTRDVILLHNHDDIAQLARLVPILRRCDLHRALGRLGFPAGDMIIRGRRISADGLTVRADLTKPARNYASFPTAERPCRLFCTESGDVEIEFPAERIGKRLSVLDAARLLPDIKRIPDLSGIESGYLILDERYAAAVNAFLLAFCPAAAGSLTRYSNAEDDR